MSIIYSVQNDHIWIDLMIGNYKELICSIINTLPLRGQVLGEARLRLFTRYGWKVIQQSKETRINGRNGKRENLYVMEYSCSENGDFENEKLA